MDRHAYPFPCQCPVYLSIFFSWWHGKGYIVCWIITNLPVNSAFDIGSCTKFISQHFCNSRNLIFGWNDKRNHACTIAKEKGKIPWILLVSRSYRTVIIRHYINIPWAKQIKFDVLRARPTVFTEIEKK